MSRVMLTGEGDFTVVRGGNVEVKEGLGYVTEAILDQHFVARQRQNRLISVVLEHPELPGIGVDELDLDLDPPRPHLRGHGRRLGDDLRRSSVGRPPGRRGRKPKTRHGRDGHPDPHRG